MKKQYNLFDRYLLTERADDVLIGLCSSYFRKRYREEMSDIPDRDLIEHCTSKIKKYHLMKNTPSNFQNLERMDEIIKIYSPLLRRLDDEEYLLMKAR